MKCSIIIPVYNEETTIDELLDRILAVDIEKEIIIVDDGSSDTSSVIIKEKQQSIPDIIRIHTHHHNLGKGEAIKTGLKSVCGEIIIIQDADLELDPQEYIKLIEPIIQNKAQVVYGSRFSNKLKNKNIPLIIIIVNKLLAGLTNLLFGCALTDEATAYKVFKTDVLKTINLECSGFEFCPEVTAKLLKKGYNILEVPIGYHPRNKNEGKKLRLIDGIKAVYTLIKLRFMD